MNPVHPVSWDHVAWSALLLLLPGLMSVGLGLKIFKDLVKASVRCVLQLIFIGYVLLYVFDWNHWGVIFGLVTVMCWIAIHTALARVSAVRFAWFGLEFVAIWLSTFFVGSIVAGLIIGPTPWYQASVFIPLCGMILGNSLNGISLGLERYFREVRLRRAEIEMLQSFGATPLEAVKEPLREALRAGMTPILNAMTVAGIVSLPGMMTGQIMAGIAPLTAVHYQIVVMFMIAAAVALGGLLTLLVAYHKVYLPGGELKPDL